MTNIFTVDVEDYFHPTEISGTMGPEFWPQCPSRIEVGLNVLLEQLAAVNTKGTFFILGWVADAHPGIVRKILKEGHEIGCHSYLHRLVYQLTPEAFREDTRRAVGAIEDATGVTPRLYRAPSYSIVRSNFWALEVLVEQGFTHDSSIVPIHHDRYGIPGAARHAHTIMTPSGPIIEVPVATAKLPDNRITPVGGGAYLRLFPYRYTAGGIRRINRLENQAACLYFHPWEMDPDQPRLATGFISRLRTYSGLSSMNWKLRSLLRDFEFSTMTAVHPCPNTLAFKAHA